MKKYCNKALHLLVNKCDICKAVEEERKRVFNKIKHIMEDDYKDSWLEDLEKELLEEQDENNN